MAGRDGWFKRLNARACLFKGYCSILGLKIAVLTGAFFFIQIAAYLVFHEYRKEGSLEIFTAVTSPLLWAILLANFAVLMFFLSKLVILPLKKFELHIGELESGVKAGPFVLERNDEIGFLAERFNSLHKAVTNEIGTKDAQLSVLYRFTNATSGIFDIPELMENFFNILRTVVPFGIGAYVLGYLGNTEGRIYSGAGALAQDEAEDVTLKVLASLLKFRRDFQEDKLGGCLGVSVIGTDPGLHAKDVAGGRTVELPLVCFGEPVGVVTLFYDEMPTYPVPGFEVFESMVAQASMVIERLLSHITEEKRQLSDILSSMSEGVYLIDGQGRTTSVNKKGMELAKAYCAHSFECSKTGFDGIEGSCPVNPSERCEFSTLINRIRRLGSELDGQAYTEEIRNNAGAVFLVSANTLNTGGTRKDGYVVTTKDITEEKLIQNRVMLSSKLAALGEMAAGIAHEVNNPLQVLLANLELLEDGLTEKSKKRLGNLKDGVFRIRNIVKDLLIFAREQTTEVEDIDVNKVIGKVVDILGHQLKVANIDLSLNLDRRALMVRCNRNLFQQVMINLLHNAKDAVEESGKGSAVNIRTELLPSGIVVVEVGDDGPGIPEKVVDRIFDPFFTTKDVGKGTGLGLSVSRRIVEDMGGNISVKSSSVGTMFTITLLQSKERRREDRLPEKIRHDYSNLAGKSVIVVDDEEATRTAIMDIISTSPAKVESVPDGRTALEKIMAEDYDLILLDIKMPGMNGMELYRRIRDVKPYLAQRVVFLTGDTENESTKSFIKLTGCNYLAKPFEREELLGLMSRYELETCG